MRRLAVKIGSGGMGQQEVVGERNRARENIMDQLTANSFVCNIEIVIIAIFALLLLSIPADLLQLLQDVATCQRFRK